MIRILHMIGSLELGGSQTMIMNIYRRIDKNIIQFDFIIDHTADMYYADEIRALGGIIYTMPTFTGANIWKIYREWNIFFKEHPEYKIIHSHVRSYASIFLQIAKKYSLITIIHSHNTSNGKGIKSFIKNSLQFPLKYQGDYFMACSELAGKWLFGEKIIENKNFMIVRNGIDSKKFMYDIEKRMKIRKEFNINKNEFVVGYLARVVEQKNPLFMIDVFKEIVDLCPTATCLFVGDGELLSKVKNKAKELGIYDKIIFTGLRTDSSDLLSAMDVYILPSFWEGLGMSLIEAQASGLQCFCSENIQKEAIITNLVNVKKLGDGAYSWAKNVLNYSNGYVRKSRENDVINNGFDISLVAEEMEKFYFSLGNCD